MNATRQKSRDLWGLNLLLTIGDSGFIKCLQHFPDGNYSIHTPICQEMSQEFVLIGPDTCTLFIKETEFLTCPLTLSCCQFILQENVWS